MAIPPSVKKTIKEKNVLLWEAQEDINIMKEKKNLLMTEMASLQGTVKKVKDVKIPQEEAAQEHRLQGAVEEVKDLLMKDGIAVSETLWKR